MNLFVKKCIMVIVLCFSVLNLSAAQDNAPRVWVMPFSHPENINKEDAVALTGRFESSLVETGAFIVVKQSAVNVILKAQSLSLEDYADRNSAVKIGQIVSANHIFLGTINRIGARFSLDVQLIDIEKGQVIKAVNTGASSLEGLFDKTGDIANGFTDSGARKSQPLFTNKVKIYIEMGDKSLADQNYPKAVEQYEKALAIEEFNPDIIRRCISAKLEKMLADSLYDSHAVIDGLDIALRNDYQNIRFIPTAETDNILEQILLLKTIDSNFEKDVSLLLNEAVVYKINGKVDQAVKVLEKAAKLSPSNPAVSGELGLLTAFRAYQLNTDIQPGTSLIKQAIEMQPENPLYSLYLARSLDRDNKKITAEAIREYRKAAELASADNWISRRIHAFAAQSLQRLFYDLGAYDGGVATSRLNMDMEERLDHLLYLVNNNITFYTKTDIQNPDYFLAVLYFAAGQTTEADKMVHVLIKNNKTYWIRNATLLNFFKQVLEKSKLDPALLAEVVKHIQSLRPGL